MNLLRVLDNTHRAQQRLGFAKYVAARAASTSTSSLETLGRDLVSAVTQRVTVPYTAEVSAYARRRLTDRAYTELKRQIQRLEEDFDAGYTLSLETQDAYLASPALPSHTGKLVADDWRKYPPLLLSLGLIRKGTYSAMVMGHTLLRLVPNGEIAAFRNYMPESNPLLLDNRQRIFFLFLFLERDGDVLKSLYEQLLSREGTFTDREAGDLLPPIFRALARERWPRARSSDERSQLQSLQDIADNIERWHGKPYSGKGAREHNITVRLEPFVDIGLLAKDDPFAYSYRLHGPGRAFTQNFTQAEEISDFLEHGFFRAASDAFGLAAQPADEDHMLSRFYQAYTELKSPLGYAPIKDTALLAGVRSLADEGLRFEIGEAMEVLKQAQREQPRTIRFNIDRMGNLVYVKFLAGPLAREKAGEEFRP